MVITNSLLAVFVIWVTAILVLRRKRTEDRISQPYQRVEKRTQELSALTGVTVTASGSLELDTIVKEVIKKITGIFHLPGRSRPV